MRLTCLPTPRTANLALLVGLTACLICLPLLRHVNSFGDEGVWLGAADRLAGGERLYVDFFEFLPPGSFLIVQGWFYLVGSSFAAARGLAVLTLSAIAALAYLCCREASRNNLASVMAVLFWLAASPPMWLMEVNHHWFTTLFSTAAALMALRACRAGPGSPVLPLLCGLAGGAAAMVTPTQGALTLLAAAASLAGPGGVRRLAWLAAGCAAVPLLMLAYIVHQDSFAAAVADVLFHTATRYATIQALPYGDGGGLLHTLVLIHPLNLLLLAGVCRQDWPGCRRDPTLRTAAAFALAGFVAVFPRPDLVHIAFSLPLTLPLTACCAARLARTAARRAAFVCTAAAGALICCAALPLLEAQARPDAPTATARGDAMFAHATASAALVTRLAAEPTSERVFFYPYMPMLPYLAKRRQVSRYDLFTPHYTTDLQYHEACAQMMRDASLVVVDWRWADMAFLHMAFPAMPDGGTAAKDALEAALRSRFASIWRSGPYEILRRTAGGNDADPACSGGT